MGSSDLGAAFEREIREQPAVWTALAKSDKADRLAAAIQGDTLLVGSGSSLFVAELGALALRRRGIHAQALAATEARLDHLAYIQQTVIAISQSGRSTDLFEAIDVLKPRKLIALTNTIDSPLASRSHLAIDVGAGPEKAVPASKSVTSTVAVLLRAASLISGEKTRGEEALLQTAATIEAWFDSPGCTAVTEAAKQIARCSSAIILGSDYGLPVALETALKLKEASYLHAEGFAAGEFRHGSVAMVDAQCAVIGIVDADALATVARPMREVKASGALRFVIGGSTIDDIQRLGPVVEDPYNTLAWLVTAQCIALHVARARGVDSDAPRGLTKALTDPA
jgi:glucosamine--fructose-6-phosphate aminotransferase (isomerizing)